MKAKIVGLCFLMGLLLAACATSSPRQKPAGQGAARQAVMQMADDPVIQAAMAKGRRTSLNDPTARKEILGQTITEQRTLLQDPQFGPQLLNHNLQIIDRMLHSTQHQRQLLKENAAILKAMTQDPETRPIVVDSFLALMQDPKLKSALEMMIAQAVQKAMAAGGGSGGSSGAGGSGGSSSGSGGPSGAGSTGGSPAQ